MYTLEIERIGNNGWVAEITGLTDGKPDRTFLRGIRDYSRANKPRTRGVYEVFDLEAGVIYEISEPTSWSNTHRRFSRVEGDSLVEMTAADVSKWFARPADVQATA